MDRRNREKIETPIIRLQVAGDFVTLPIPPAILEQLGLAARSQVQLSMENGRMAVAGADQPQYDLEVLLAQLDRDIAWDEEDRLWIDAAPMGKEMF